VSIHAAIQLAYNTHTCCVHFRVLGVKVCTSEFWELCAARLGHNWIIWSWGGNAPPAQHNILSCRVTLAWRANTTHFSHNQHYHAGRVSACLLCTWRGGSYGGSLIVLEHASAHHGVSCTSAYWLLHKDSQMYRSLLSQLSQLYFIVTTVCGVPNCKYPPQRPTSVEQCILYLEVRLWKRSSTFQKLFSGNEIWHASTKSNKGHTFLPL
jgi:hypothetical protein